MSDKNIDKDIETIKDFTEYSKNMINDMEYERPVDVTIDKNDIRAIENVLSELETLKSEIKKYKHGMAMISEICIDESKVHITTREAIEEIRKNIYHGIDRDWARKEVLKDE